MLPAMRRKMGPDRVFSDFFIEECFLWTSPLSHSLLMQVPPDRTGQRSDSYQGNQEFEEDLPSPEYQDQQDDSDQRQQTSRQVMGRKVVKIHHQSEPGRSPIVFASSTLRTACSSSAYWAWRIFFPLPLGVSP
jgi:hypothetical protein